MTARTAALFVDVSHTVAYGMRTGVQRVVRRITAELVASDPVGVVPVVAIGGRFYQLTDPGQRRLSSPEGDVAPFGQSSPLRRAASRLLRRTPIYERRQERSASARTDELLRQWAATDPIDAHPSDVVVLIDAFWGGTSALAAATALQRKGLKLVVVVYDMIPWSHPAYMPDAIVKTFGPRMRRALRAADGALAISRNCAGEVTRFMGADAPPVRHFYLGNDFAPRDSAIRKADAGYAYVMVGTIEPRKGHATVLDAFEQRWARGDDVSLCFLGRIGWADPALVARCLNHPQRGRRFTVVDHADDAALAAALASASATIVASRAEGFGLPLVESLAADLPVIASDIAVFREIAGDAILYFDPVVPESLVMAMESFEKNPARHRTAAAAFSWPDWRESANQFRQALTDQGL